MCILTLALVGALVAASLGPACSDPPRDGTVSPLPLSDILSLTVRTIDGEEQPLGTWRGRVLLIVNVASRCGYTPQYEGLQRLYESRRERGLVVLGFPSNDFGEQEPGNEEQIREFCRATYGVTFPMFSKVRVRGAERHPLYDALTRQPEPLGGEPRWNFTKFLVDRRGRVVARFEPKVRPDDPALLRVVDEELARPFPVPDR